VNMLVWENRFDYLIIDWRGHIRQSSLSSK
jgi:hypothetical protein